MRDSAGDTIVHIATRNAVSLYSMFDVAGKQLLYSKIWSQENKYGKIAVDLADTHLKKQTLAFCLRSFQSDVKDTHYSLSTKSVLPLAFLSPPSWQQFGGMTSVLMSSFGIKFKRHNDSSPLTIWRRIKEHMKHSSISALVIVVQESANTSTEDMLTILSEKRLATIPKVRCDPRQTDYTIPGCLRFLLSDCLNGIFYSSIGRRGGFVNADVKLRLKPA